MQLTNQSSGKPDMLSQGSTKLDKLSPEFNGGTLDIRKLSGFKRDNQRIQKLQRTNPQKKSRKQSRGEC